MDHTPLFSVIIPCYKSAETLPQTLQSLEEQSLSSWEGLIIDDGSPDQVSVISHSWVARDRRFKLFRQENCGLSAARNLGIKNASGKYVLFLDSDDLIANRKLEKHAVLAESSDANAVVYGGCRFFRGDKPDNLTAGRDGSAQPWMPNIEGSGSTVMSKLVNKNIVPVSAPTVSRELISKVGGFDEQLTSFEDWDYWIRLTLQGAIWNYTSDQDAETWIRVSDQSMSAFDERMFKNEHAVRMKHRAVPEMKASLKNQKKFHLKAALTNFKEGKWKIAYRRLRYFVPSL